MKLLCFYFGCRFNSRCYHSTDSVSFSAPPLVPVSFFSPVVFLSQSISDALFHFCRSFKFSLFYLSRFDLYCRGHFKKKLFWRSQFIVGKYRRIKTDIWARRFQMMASYGFVDSSRSEEIALCWILMTCFARQCSPQDKKKKRSREVTDYYYQEYL